MNIQVDFSFNWKVSDWIKSYNEKQSIILLMYATKYWKGERVVEKVILIEPTNSTLFIRKEWNIVRFKFSHILACSTRERPDFGKLYQLKYTKWFYRKAYNSFLVFMTVSRKAALKNFSTIKLVVKWLSMQRFMNIQKALDYV